MDSYKRERIDSLIEVLSEILGTRESVYETMALVFLDQHEITIREYEEIMENISRCSKVKEKEKERMGVIQS